MTPRRVYLVYDGILSPVFDSQVVTPLCKLQERGLPHDLVAFSSYRSFIRSREYKEKMREIRQRLAGNCLFFRTMPYYGQLSLLYPMLRLRLAMRRLGIRKGDPVIVHARAHQAAAIALTLRKFYPQLNVIANLRGAAAPEVSAYKQWGGRIDYQFTARRQASALKSIEDAVVREADSIICVSNSFARYLESQHKLAGGRLRVVPTAVDTDTFRFDPEVRENMRRRLGLDSKLVLTYNGSAHEWELPPQVLRVFQSISERCTSTHLLILSTQLTNWQREVGWAGVPEESVTLLSVPHKQVPGYLMAGDVGLLIREKNLVNRVAAPTKFGEYLACGLPVLLTKGIGDTEEAICDHDVGWLMDDLSDESLARMGEQIAKQRAKIMSPMHKEQCAQAGRKLYSWDSHISSLLSIYRDLEMVNN